MTSPAPIPEGPIEAFRLTIERIWDYRGRSTRAEYWWSQLGLGLLSVIGVVIFYVIFGLATNTESLLIAAVVIGIAIIIAISLSQLSLHIRRYRDAGINPWILFLVVGASAVPILNLASFIYDLWVLCKPSFDQPIQNSGGMLNS